MKATTAIVDVVTPDALLAEALDRTNPDELRCRALVALDDALLAARAAGQEWFELALPGETEPTLTNWPEAVALAVVFAAAPLASASTPTHNGRRAERRRRAAAVVRH